MTISILAALLIFFSLLFETLGFNFRRIGKMSNKPSLGYSLHVQFATVSRLGIFIGFPLIGILIDKSSELNTIILVPVISYFLISSSLFICARYIDRLDGLFKIFFKFQLRISNLEDINFSNKDIDPNNLFSRKRVILLGAISFLFASSGIFFVSILSFIFSDFKATILLSSPAITAIGTLVSVIFFDPFISRQIDDIDEPINVIKYVYISRAFSSLILFILFSILYFYA